MQQRWEAAVSDEQRNNVVARAQNVLNRAELRRRRALIHSEDGAGADVAVDVGRAIERVDGDAEAASMLGFVSPALWIAS